MKRFKKIAVILSVLLAVILAVLGILWYYQSQGMIKIFPTKSEMQAEKILIIDRTKFTPPENASPEKVETAIKNLEELKEAILKDPNKSDLWSEFGYYKDYLNDLDGAALAYKKALEVGPYNTVPAANLGNLYLYFKNDYEQAEYYYLYVLEIEKDSNAAYEGLMDLYRYADGTRTEKYEPLVLRAIKDDSGNKVRYYGQLVEFFVDKPTQNLDKAKSYLAEVKKLDQSAADAITKRFSELR